MLTYTLAEMIDKLVIINLKQWHLEEKISDDSITLEERGKLTEQVDSLNKYRMKVIAAIDEWAENHGNFNS